MADMIEPDAALRVAAAEALDAFATIADAARADLGRRGMTMVVVTHEMGFARKVADQVIFMDEGRVIEAGSPSQIFDTPSSPRLRHFLAEVL